MELARRQVVSGAEADINAADDVVLRLSNTLAVLMRRNRTEHGAKTVEVAHKLVCVECGVSLNEERPTELRDSTTFHGHNGSTNG